MNYFDTSALIKRFVTEMGSRRVDAIVRRDPSLATSKIAYAEVHAGLARKRREGAARPADYRLAARAFDRDWTSYLRVELGDDVLGLTRTLVQRHPLRGFDAIHLASALRLRDLLGEEIGFVAADARLLEAAAREAFTVVTVGAG